MKDRTYIAIDLKSFYASVECQERGLDPLDTNLVVADLSRTEKTICLAVSPSLKAYKIPGRDRLFDVVQRMKEVNAERRSKAPGHRLSGSSCLASELDRYPELAADYIVATPRMALYIDYSTRVYNVYLRHIAPEDIHVYSIDEVFMDVTDYLPLYRLTAEELATKMIHEVIKETGITATAGIGTNLYLAKIAMDIIAKHVKADKNGVRIACLDELSYRSKLWEHRPLTDFWRVGRGYGAKLEEHRLYTMGDIARCSLHNEDLLYRLFGKNAELLIDHAWGVETCTMKDIKDYRPSSNSLGSGQVLSEPYSYEKAKLVVREMTDLLSLDLVDKGLVTDQLTVGLGYDRENMKEGYSGSVKLDHYGREVPQSAHGSMNFPNPTSSSKQLIAAATEIFARIASPGLLVRRINVTATNVFSELERGHQLDLFSDSGEEQARLEKERKLQEATLSIKKRFGKNALLRGMNLEEGATAKARNSQIGGHKA